MAHNREARIIHEGAGIVFVADWEAFEFHITAQPSYSPTTMRDVVLPLAAREGLTLLTHEESPPELTADGSTRIHLVPAADVEAQF
ncbi:hypothetical protein AB0H73_18620 [Streptomyces olivoreticuli]